MRNLLKDNKELMKEWDKESNDKYGFNLEKISSGSHYKTYWICSKCGFKWSAIVKDRSAGHGCPECAKKERVSTLRKNIIKKNGNLKDNFPMLMKEWDFVKNKEIDPSMITISSNKRVWWKCKNCGYEWQTAIANRTGQNTNCPKCKNRISRVFEKNHKIKKEYLWLKDYWNTKKNSVNLENYYGKLSEKSYWKCPICNYEWKATLLNILKQKNVCPNCYKSEGRNVIHNGRFFKTSRIFDANHEINSEYIWLINSWDSKRNGVELKNYYGKLSKSVWWKCEKCGNEWKRSISARADGSLCPKCAIKISRDKATKNKIEKQGSLLDNYPELSKEWNYEKNTKQPSEVLAGSRTKYWWICPICGNEWKATVDHRSRGSGCPKCYRRNQTSFPEQVIYFYIKKAFPKACNKYKDIFTNGMELDIYIPELKIGIEYDGYAWHNDHLSIKREKEKYKHCKNNNIQLIRIKEIRKQQEKSNSDYSDITIFTDYNNKTNYESLNIMLKEIFKVLNIDVKIDIKKDSSKIKSKYYTTIKENNLLDKFPILCEEWNYEKNNDLTPEMFKPYSNEKVWWKCENCGNEWEAVIANRSRGTGCPKCTKKSI